MSLNVYTHMADPGTASFESDSDLANTVNKTSDSVSGGKCGTPRLRERFSPGCVTYAAVRILYSVVVFPSEELHSRGTSVYVLYFSSP